MPLQVRGDLIQPATPSDPLAPALQATGLRRRYGTTVALRGIDLTLQRGERIALVGPNGAGKTTLIRVLSLALSPSEGSLVIGGINALTNGGPARRLLGTVGHRTGLYDDLTPRENLRFYGRLYGVRDLEARVGEVLTEVGVRTVADQPLRTLSRGMQQRAAIARALLHEPLVLLLDEPETGLDQEGQQWLAGLIQRWAELGRALLVATHRLEWAPRVADRTLVLKDGALAGILEVSSGQGAELAAAYRAALAQAP